MLASDFIRMSKKSLFAADFFGVVKPWTHTHTYKNKFLCLQRRVISAHFSGLLSLLGHDFALFYERQEKLHYDMKQDTNKRCSFTMDMCSNVEKTVSLFFEFESGHASCIYLWKQYPIIHVSNSLFFV